MSSSTVSALSRKIKLVPAQTGPRAGMDGATPPPPTNLIEGRDLRPLGQILLEDEAVSAQNLLKAVVMRQRQDAPLGEILLTHDWVSEEALTRALSRQWRSSQVDLKAMPPDPRLIDRIGADRCIAAGILPWRRVGGVTYVACARPDEFAETRKLLPEDFGAIRMLLASETALREAALGARRSQLARRAETCVAAAESCRSRNDARIARLAGVVLALLALGLWFAPLTMLSLITGWTILTLIATMSLKTLAFASVIRDEARARRKSGTLPERLKAEPEMKGPLPVISVMVPLFNESDIAGRLVERLSRLTYPRELTDVLLVIEESDKVTSEALAQTRLPRWIRTVTVPDGPVQTKPRALNFALSFCRGQIIGVWDAEDRPEPDQLHKIARGFHFAAPDVACLQGALDFYNPRTNWLARCFTIEYATWFRANLRGVARLGLVVPLGGTTMFIRRKALEEVGCWDAHNVTEDADLGVRLARRGWRTEMIDTVTHEEANCRALPWVKQRSRWLKGYAMTWAVHMRQPRQLWRELGPRRFWGFQTQFLGGLSQYLLAPVLWSFWALAFGLPHPLEAPLQTVWNGWALTLLITTMIATEVINICAGLWAVREPEHRHLLPWVPSLHLYFPLGCLAGWKALYEVVARPFFWDKTSHGHFDEISTEGDDASSLTSSALVELQGELTERPAHEDEGTPVQVLGTVG
ncbi:glycosyltransferase family 2 protein [Paracoccus aminophilus]|uniref:Glycosyltransferase n=1 Tax=Paracoccus aminophilus JCM 7686 TaxID=1367847 RepID=S5XQ44_PARAH|nr:glycosyltransferase [Paracoccus aminophilus]AGT09494.1 glycosyltransferase [Paracoccus aminophilus JCM 7686]